MADSFLKKAGEAFIQGFKPMSARADENIKKKREGGSQLDADMQLSPSERAKKVREGFLKRVNMSDEK